MNTSRRSFMAILAGAAAALGIGRKLVLDDEAVAPLVDTVDLDLAQSDEPLPDFIVRKGETLVLQPGRRYGHIRVEGGTVENSSEPGDPPYVERLDIYEGNVGLPGAVWETFTQGNPRRALASA